MWPRPSSVIDGVPPQFDELVRRATARDPADRYADAREMGAAVDAIAGELGLPAFRVPAPRNSAQHASAILHASRIERTADHRRASSPRAGGPPAPVGPPRRPTVALTRGPDDWRDTPGPDNRRILLRQAILPASRWTSSRGRGSARGA